MFFFIYTPIKYKRNSWEIIFDRYHVNTELCIKQSDFFFHFRIAIWICGRSNTAWMTSPTQREFNRIWKVSLLFYGFNKNLYNPDENPWLRIINYDESKKLVKFCLQATYSNFNVDAIKNFVETRVKLHNSTAVQSLLWLNHAQSLLKRSISALHQLVERPWCFCFHTAFVIRRIIHHRR